MLQHVALEVREADADAEAAFWALLGFAEVTPPPGLAGTSRWVQRAGTQVHLLLTDDPVAPPRGHLAVLPDDYDATVTRLRDAGFDVEPREQHWGAPRAYVRGPGGHLVELMAQRP